MKGIKNLDIVEKRRIYPKETRDIRVSRRFEHHVKLVDWTFVSW